MPIVEPSLLPYLRSRELSRTVGATWSPVLPVNRRRVGVIFYTPTNDTMLVSAFDRVASIGHGFIVPRNIGDSGHLFLTQLDYGDIVTNQWVARIDAIGTRELIIIDIVCRLDLLDVHKRNGFLGRDEDALVIEP